MENITFNETLISTNSIDCEDLTNNGLYMIFIGYIYPLLSPTFRTYMKDLFVTIKTAGKVSGQVVSLTEFGFSKLQDIKSNEDMIKFIERMCKNKNLKVLPKQAIDCAWCFSGDDDNGKKESLEQSWNKLLKELDRLHKLNIVDKTSA
jgi:hypothetical protein